MSEKEAIASPNAGTMMDATDPVSSLVVRSAVPQGLHYKKYKPYLRRDFWYSCAYCTTMESEATAARMLIDHYVPAVIFSSSDLADVYTNLMYACEPCNSRKSDRYPPPAAQADGHRFFRPDSDVRLEHFTINGLQIESTTNVGRFTINYLDLNRRGLRRIRELRLRLLEGSAIVSEGITALSKFPLDQISREFRAKAHRFIDELIAQEPEIVEDIDSLLRAYARSPLIEDVETEAEIAAKKERIKALRRGQGLYEGAWSGRRKKSKRKE
jgi:5-methylcytosine-specific restriction endonuclease McrA